MKVQISINDELLTRVDVAADSMYLSRSGYFSMAVSQLLMAFEAMDAVKTMSLAVKKIADSGEIDDATRHQIEDFERLAKMIVPSR